MQMDNRPTHKEIEGREYCIYLQLQLVVIRLSMEESTTQVSAAGRKKDTSSTGTIVQYMHLHN